MIRRTSLLSALPLAIAAVLCASCLSPTLPLPPPEEPETIKQAACDGDVCDWEITGYCLAGARVFVTDETLGRGEIFDDLNETGSYTVVLRAARCDSASVTQQDDEGNMSAGRKFVVQERAAGTVTDPKPCQ